MLKLIVTRGAGGRGYAPPTDAAPPLDPVEASAAAAAAGIGGLTLRWCDTRWRCSPRWPASSTATGSSRSWHAPNGTTRPIDEGLMRSTDGDVVSATAANLFVLHEGALDDAAGRPLRRRRRLPRLGCWRTLPMRARIAPEL